MIKGIELDFGSLYCRCESCLKHIEQASIEEENIRHWRALLMMPGTDIDNEARREILKRFPTLRKKVE